MNGNGVEKEAMKRLSLGRHVHERSLEITVIFGMFPEFPKIGVIRV